MTSTSRPPAAPRSSTPPPTTSSGTPYLHYWVPASKLKKGEHLKTANGTTAVADGGTTPADHDGWMWDLTVPGNNDHDFYVLPAQTNDHHAYYVGVGETPVLAHNAGCGALSSSSSVATNQESIDAVSAGDGFTGRAE